MNFAGFADITDYEIIRSNENSIAAFTLLLSRPVCARFFVHAAALYQQYQIKSKRTFMAKDVVEKLMCCLGGV